MDWQTEYHSMIIYHHNSPHWNETIRLTVPIDKFPSAHVRFEFRHCSSKLKILADYTFLVMNSF